MTPEAAVLAVPSFLAAGLVIGLLLLIVSAWGRP